MTVDISVRVSGQAGQGLQSISYTMGKSFTRSGYYVFLHQDVESRIRGGHNFAQVRIHDSKVLAMKNEFDLLIGLDSQTLEKDLPGLPEGGIFLYDGEKVDYRSKNPNHFSVPFDRLATEVGKAKIMVNTVATGAALSILGFEFNSLWDFLEEQFRKKGKDIVGKNQASAEAGYRYAQKHFQGTRLSLPAQGPAPKGGFFLSGSEAMAVGAICSGLKFYAGYPMSPATSIMELVASRARECKIVLEPAEDEIAAINLALGASFAGARAMTATSGGGFCLMVEGLGLAGMTETPVVVVVAQRPGPSTGLPTRTEQGDLRFVMHAAHGEFPRAILAPGDAEQAFYAMGKAFNLADRYQTPVVVMGDQHLNDSYFTTHSLDTNAITRDRGKIMNHDEVDSDQVFKRYVWHPSGVSPRILPGFSETALYADSDEHNEEGHITESAEVRTRMVQKRMAKLEGMRSEMGLPETYGDDEADILLVGWGSTYGAMKEAVDLLRQAGLGVCMAHFQDIYPLPVGKVLIETLKRGKVIAVENNYTGQFSEYLKGETGIPVFSRILKYDGRPFSPDEIATQVRESL